MRYSVCSARKSDFAPHVYTKKSQIELAYIDTLANPKIRLDSVKRMTQIQNTSQSIATTKNFRVAAQEDTLRAPGRRCPAATFADESYRLPKYTSA